MKRRFSHGEEEVRDDLPTEVRDERFRRQRRRRPKIRARSPLWVCPVASAALGHKIERRPLSVCVCFSSGGSGKTTKRESGRSAKRGAEPKRKGNRRGVLPSRAGSTLEVGGCYQSRAGSALEVGGGSCAGAAAAAARAT